MCDRRELLAELYRAGVRAVEGEACVARRLRGHPPQAPCHLIAVGKAAAAMTRGALAEAGDDLSAGLVITRAGYADADLEVDPRLRQIESAHPVPDRRSLAAGAALIEFLADAPADARFLVLISGGASSLVEVLPEGGTLAGLAELNRTLLAQGADIHAMNRARKAVSCIKGGRLARWLNGRPATVLLISDVHGDDPAVIGSGLLFPGAAPSSPQDVPAPLRGLVPPAPPAPRDDEIAGIEAAVIADNGTALAAVADAARARGLAAEVETRFIDGDAVTEGYALGTALAAADGGVRVWGGEPTVTLPESPGRGGRMQALALAAAERLAGVDDAWLLAAGSDGADGPGEDAGAIVDGGTLARGEAAGLAPGDHLARADAGTFLAASGDLLRTGGTGTNVMDIIIGLRGSDPER